MTNEEFRKYIVEKLEKMEETLYHIYYNTGGSTYSLHDIIDRLNK